MGNLIGSILRRPEDPPRLCDSCVCIPEDIIANEILVKLPVKSLLRFKCVSKSWYSIISSPEFIDYHFQLAKKNPPKLLITALIEDTGTDFNMFSYDVGDPSRPATFMFAKNMPFPIDRLLCPTYSNGLVLFKHPDELTVCNPSTREYISLPKGHACFRKWNVDASSTDGKIRADFGFVSSIGAYKFAQYYYRYCNEDSGRWRVGVEVFTLGVDTSWRVIKEKVPYPPTGEAPVVAGESMYFMIDTKLLRTETFLFFAFHLGQEKFRKVNLRRSDLPPTTKGWDFIEVESGTCFYAVSDESRKLDIYVEKGEVWVHNFSINVQQVEIIRPICIRQGYLQLHATYWNMNSWCEKLESYNLQTKAMESEFQVDLKKVLVFHGVEKHKFSTMENKLIFNFRSLCGESFACYEED